MRTKKPKQVVFVVVGGDSFPMWLRAKSVSEAKTGFYYDYGL